MFTFIVTHLLGHIPVWVWPFSAGVAVLCYFLSGVASYFPNLKPYAFLIRPLAFIVFVYSIFMYGGAGVVQIYQAEIAAAEQAAKVAQQETADANKQLQNALDDKKKIIETRNESISQEIKTKLVPLNANCNRISDDAWTIYNESVKNIPLGVKK